MVGNRSRPEHPAGLATGVAVLVGAAFAVVETVAEAVATEPAVAATAGLAASVAKHVVAAVGVAFVAQAIALVDSAAASKGYVAGEAFVAQLEAPRSAVACLEQLRQPRPQATKKSCGWEAAAVVDLPPAEIVVDLPSLASRERAWGRVRGCPLHSVECSVA